MDASPPAADHRFPCETCGSDLRFDPVGGDLLCDHCGARQPIAAERTPWASVRELDFRAALSAELPAAEMAEVRTVSCTSCGAQIELGTDIHAKVCPYCASPVVTDTGSHRLIKPKGVLPFALSEEDARKAMTDWLGSLWFAPGGLQQYARKGRRMDGIYVPYWTFDADTKSAYRGERGTVYYVNQTVVRNGRRETVQVPRVRWSPASGRVARFFDDVLVLASRSLPKTFTDGLEPWDLSALTPYRPEYLAGFKAEGYQVPLEDGFVEARAFMDRMIERDVRFDIGGDQQRVHRIETQVSDVTFKHILLPVWMAAYKYRGDTYRFVVNGRTGRVQGERPWSAWKIAFAVILGLLLALAVGYLAGGQG